MSTEEKAGRGGRRHGAGRPRRVVKLHLDPDLVKLLQADCDRYHAHMRTYPDYTPDTELSLDEYVAARATVLLRRDLADTHYERGKEAGRLLMDVIYHLPGALGLQAAKASELAGDAYDAEEYDESHYHRGRAAAYREIAELVRRALESDEELNRD